MAAWRQLRAPSAVQLSANVDAALAMPWRELSKALENAWQQAGYQVERVEGAADLRLSEKSQITLVSARRWKAASGFWTALWKTSAVFWKESPRTW